MTLPAFTAEASVYTSTHSYRADLRPSAAGGVFPAAEKKKVGHDGSVFCGACEVQGCQCEVTERPCGPWGLFTCTDRKCVNCNPRDHFIKEWLDGLFV